MTTSDDNPMRSCTLCPRMCRADRTTPEGRRRALCGASDRLRVALASLHPWEEPCLSGKTGAGTVFFSHCALRCCFCQNHRISAQGWGVDITWERLAEIFLEQQERGAQVLELVTPGHYTPDIVRALERARARGLSIPTAWNSSGYETEEALSRLEGLVDIFLPDLKYIDDRLAEKYSGAPHYFHWASRALRKMFAMTGPVRLDERNHMLRGMIVRHLILPWQWRESCRVLDWLHSTFGDDVWISIMNQYTPCWKADRHPELRRRLFTLESQKVEQHALAIGIRSAFVQVGTTADAKFIPLFDGRNVAQADDAHVSPRSVPEAAAAIL